MLRSTASNEWDPQPPNLGFNQHLQGNPKFCVYIDPVASVKGNPFSGAAMARTTHFSSTSSSAQVHGSRNQHHARNTWSGLPSMACCKDTTVRNLNSLFKKALWTPYRKLLSSKARSSSPRVDSKTVAEMLSLQLSLAGLLIKWRNSRMLSHSHMRIL